MILLGYQTSVLEIVASVISLISISLLSRVSIWNWPLSIISQILFMFLFFKVGFFVIFALQIYFCIISVYSWISWKNQGDLLKIRFMTKRERFWFYSGLIISIPIFYMLNKYISYSSIESIVCFLSIIASYLMSKKIIDSWLIWIIVDLLCIYLYYITGIFLISFEYIIILFMAIYGYFKWQKMKNDFNI